MLKKVIKGDTYRFTILTNQLLRMEYSLTGNFVDETTQVVVNRKITDSEELVYNVLEDDATLEIYTKYFHLYYKKNEPFTKLSLYIDFFFAYQPYGNRWYYGDPIDDLKGTARTLDWADGETELDRGIISYSGFSVLDDSLSHFLNENNEIFEKEIKTIDLYVFAFGHEYEKAMHTFFQLTGFSPKLPRYALGNWWSRFWRYSDEEYRKLIIKFKTKKIPLSVAVIDMDWHVTDIPEGFGSGWTGYSWNKELFPNPANFMDWLHHQGLAVTLNLHPADGVRAFEDAYEAMAERLKLDTSINEPAAFDFSSSEFREAYFEEVLHPNEADGVDFWWIDWQQGKDSGVDGLDPLWLLNHYHSEDLKQRGKEALILSRYAGPGSHRYPIGFSGDSIITWESLQFQPYMTATASNIGYTWWSHDIGGHMRGYSDEELAVRWVQFGVFSPINRLHSSNSIFMGKEPWSYGLETETVMSNFLRLRHQLIPYLYTANVQTHEEGMPLIRPLYYGESDNISTYQYPNEYYFGSELIVLPVTSKMNSYLHRAAEDIYFPMGDWYDVWTNLRYKGSSSLRIYRTLDRIPVFAKAGAILPLDNRPTETKADQLPLIMTWRIYPGPSNQYRLIEELDGKRVETVLSIDTENKLLSLTVEGNRSILPENRSHELIFCGTEPFDIVGYETKYFSEKNELLVQTPVVNQPTKMNIDGFEKIAQQSVRNELFDLLNEASINYLTKEEVWSNFNKGDLMQILSSNQRVQDKALEEVLFELIYILSS